MSAQDYWQVTADIASEARELMKPGVGSNRDMSLHEAAAYLRMRSDVLDTILWRNLGRRA